MQLSPFALEQQWRAAGAVDPALEHSEFSQVPPFHGQKVDADSIVIDTPEFNNTVDTTVGNLQSIYDAVTGSGVLVSVANGANRFVQPVAQKLGIIGLETIKVRPGVAILPPHELQRLRRIRPELAVVLDDVGTTGSTTASTATTLLWAGVKRVEVLYMWQRCPTLPRLIDLGIAHRAIINTPMPTFTAEECRTQPEGFCARGWLLNPYKKDTVNG